MSTEAAGGTYTLVIELPEPVDIEVGALGVISFDTGWYAYVGSALGSGGFSRVDRHRELAAGDRDTRHWHIDYLLGHPTTRLDTVVTTAGVDGECPVARALGGDGVPEFGCSDCDCGSHLIYEPVREDLLAAVESAHETIR